MSSQPSAAHATKKGKPAAESGNPAASTDAIVEELKALAASMVSATNAARVRIAHIESKNPYAALMNALDSRAEPNGGAAGRTHYRDPNLTGTEDSFNTSAELGSEELLTDIPAALSPVSKNGAGTGKAPVAKAGERGHAASDDDGDDGEEARHDAPSQAMRSVKPVTRGHPRRASLSVESEEESSDGDDEKVRDGVKTQVLFSTTDHSAYREVVASTWKPEKLNRKADGSSTAPDGYEEDEDDEEEKDKDSNDSRGGDDDSGEAATVSMHTRNRGKAAAAVAVSKPVKVFRVPYFPFGGGVTESQARYLQEQFDDCLRQCDLLPGERKHGNATADGTQLDPLSVKPTLITKEAFDCSNYPEVAAAAPLASFTPHSPYEFVVEVERDVCFDAARTRVQRRRAFKQLVRENRAPATMGTFNLRIVMDPFKTGFEDEKEFPIEPWNVVADRYQIVQMLGKATFSRTVRCRDLHKPIYEDTEEGEEAETDEKEVEAGSSGDANDGEEDRAKPRKSGKLVGYEEVCLKIINNSKDFFDQSLDEIRLLTLVNTYKNPDDVHVVRLIDAFYYKEHTMLVTELLSDNLYEFARYNREREEELYFTLDRLRRITRQVVEALAYVHSLNLIHSDLKPENIMFVSHRRCIVKVIDFGSSCFLSDHLSSYVQSRSYRAPEVVLGCDYDGRIDVWSLGAILAELVTGDVLFPSDTVPEMLARIVHVCGSTLPRRMLWEGRTTHRFINKFGCIFEYGSSGGDAAAMGGHPRHRDDDDEEEPYYLYTPVPDAASSSPSAAARGKNKKEANVAADPPVPFSVLRKKLAEANMLDEEFISFVEACLHLDHKKRPTTAELLQHPFIANEVV